MTSTNPTVVIPDPEAEIREMQSAAAAFMLNVLDRAAAGTLGSRRNRERVARAYNVAGQALTTYAAELGEPAPPLDRDPIERLILNGEGLALPPRRTDRLTI